MDPQPPKKFIVLRCYDHIGPFSGNFVLLREYIEKNHDKIMKNLLNEKKEILNMMGLYDKYPGHVNRVDYTILSSEYYSIWSHEKSIYYVYCVEKLRHECYGFYESSS